MLPPTISEKLKETALWWVRGTSGLTLIYNSLPNRFLPLHEYENVYCVIKEALRMPTIGVLSECCQIIKVIMSSADYIETESIYLNHSDLMVLLLSALTPLVEDTNVSSLVGAVISLTDTFENIILDYARTGVALLATRMIVSKIDDNVSKGIEMIRHIS